MNIHLDTHGNLPLQFSFLPGYAKFILDHLLREVAIDQLQTSRELNIPLLQYFNHFSDEEMVDMLISFGSEFFTLLSENKASTQIETAVQRWMNDQLPQLQQGQIVVEDITLLNYMRKQVLVRHIKKYTLEADTIIGIVNELDTFLAAAETAALKTYAQIVSQELKEQSDFVEKIHNTSPGIIYVLDVENDRVAYANRQLYDLLGYAKDEMPELDKDFLLHFEHPGDQPAVSRHFQDLMHLQDGGQLTLRHRLKHKDGSYRWMSSHETVYKRKADGTPGQVIGVALDIDDLQRTSEMLNQREEQLLQAQELAEIGSFEWNLDTLTGTTSPQLLKILDYSNKEELNNFIEHVHPADKEKVRQAVAHAVKNLGLYDYECRYICQGRQKTIWARGAVVKENGRHIVRGTIMDVSQRHHMLKQLQHSDQLFKEAQALTHIGNWTWDVQRDVVEWSDEMYRIYDMEPQSEKITFTRFATFIHPDDKETRLQLLRQSLETKKSAEYIFRIVTAKQNTKILQGKNEVRTDSDGTAVSMIGTCQDVTERQLLFERLQQSEKLFKQAQALSHMGNWMYDLGRQQIEWSDEMYHIYGIDPATRILTYDDLFRLNHPGDAQMVVNEMAKSVATGGHNFFYRIILPDKTIKTVHSRGETIYDHQGKAIKMIGTAQDVTRQKMIEKELLDNQNFIHKIADTTPSIITTFNVYTGRYRFVSEGLKKLLGYEANELLIGGNDFLTPKIHADDQNLVAQKTGEAIEASNAAAQYDSEIIAEFKYRVLHKNGTYRWLHTYGTVFDRDENGQVENFMLVSVDITENIENEKLLREQEHFIERIAEASPTILYLFDIVEKRFVYVNREVKEVLGYEPHEIIALGDKVSTMYLHPEDDIKSLENYVKYTNASGTTTMHQFEGRVKNKSGKWVWILTREIVFKRDENGKPIQVLGSALDITTRKEMEGALVYRTHQLQQSNASLEEFAHVASHDLQEPLRKIITFGERLVSINKEALTPEGSGYLDKIVKSARRMQQLVNDILSISIISGEQNFEPYDLDVLLEEVKQTLEFKIEDKKAVITCEKLPAARVNPSQFRQLFQNIISNSLKFTQGDAAPVITITHEFIKGGSAGNLRLQKASRYLKIVFTDNGIGFDDIFSEKIFSIFQRLNGMSAYEGTGIGLAICKKIVENHGGYITAHGQPGKGAEFIIVVPA